VVVIGAGPAGLAAAACLLNKDSGKEVGGSGMKVAIIDGHTDIQGQVCTYVFIHLYVNTYLCMYIYIESISLYT
jgi:2-polyprenyl-6-methoxyphenol hydroxylase-like FAD-dependent oxidoreductase